MDFGACEGRRIGRYEVLARLASGGMGTVYLARLGGLGGFQRLYAVKQLHPHLAESRDFINMFLDEARLAAKIHHPHVVPILEVGEEVTAPSTVAVSSPGYFVVMEYVEGATSARLASRARRTGGLPPGVAIRITLDALAGLDCAHDLVDDDGHLLNLVHRDVSPDNILVGVDGLSRLIDFGVARAAERVHHSRAGELKGKLSYMAPEQAQGRTVDRRADIFAMGVVLWEALTDARLFKSPNDVDTLRRLLYDPIPRAKSQRATVPAELDDICARALARDPAERYATARQFSDALEQAALTCRLTATHRDVAALVTDLMSRDISERREFVRSLARSSRPSSPRSTGEADSEDLGGAATVAAANQGGSSSVSAAMAVPSRPHSLPPDAQPMPSQPARRRIRVGDVAIAAGLVVLGGLALWRATSTVSSPSAVDPTANAAQPVSPGVAAAEPPPISPVSQADPNAPEPPQPPADRPDGGFVPAPGANPPAIAAPAPPASTTRPSPRRSPGGLSPGGAGKPRDKNADFGDRW